MIEPSIGRVVWFRPGKNLRNVQSDLKQPLAALVVYVHGSRLVNLSVFDALGKQHAFANVPLLQDDDKAPEGDMPHAEWMPFQKGQAQKTEQVEKVLEACVPKGTPSGDGSVLINPAHDFGFALLMLKQGQRVARAGWNGKGMWLALSCDGTREVPAAGFWAPPNREYAEANGGKATVLPSITMKTATGEILMGWLASQTDMLAEDWTVVE